MEKRWPANPHHDHYDPALGWILLGGDGKNDYYINHQWEYVSIVYGNEPWEYVSPEYNDCLAVEVPLMSDNLSHPLITLKALIEEREGLESLQRNLTRSFSAS